MTSTGRGERRGAGGPGLAVDVDAFTDLLRQHDPQMRKLAYSIMRDPHATDDALQNAYLKAFRKLDTFSGQSAFNTWLYTIVYRTCIDELRRRRPTEPLDDDVGHHQLPDPIPEPGQRLSTITAIDDALAQLPAAQRAVVLLVDGEGLSSLETSTVLGIAPGTVGSRLHRARTTLRRILNADHPMEGDR